VAQAVAVKTVAIPEGPAGPPAFVSLDFLRRLIMVFGNGRSESVNAQGQRVFHKSMGAATSVEDQFCRLFLRQLSLKSSRIRPSRVRPTESPKVEATMRMRPRLLVVGLALLIWAPHVQGQFADYPTK
jgi:hypothetical protein